MKIKPAINRFSSKGFTLIELLIVIAILGVLAAGVVVAVDPLTKINSANLAKAETFAASIQNSLAMDLVGEWTFNDGTAKDTSGYGNNGTVYGATLTTDRKGQANKAYSFNGTSGYVEAGSINHVGFGGLTVEFWVYRSSDGVRVIPVAAGYGPWQFNIGLSGSNRVGLEIDIDNGYYHLTSGNSPSITAGKWWHLAVTHNLSSGAIVFYINGVAYPGTTQTGLAYVGNSTIRIAHNSTNVYFAGTIDDVRIYKSALLSSQIQQLYAQGIIKHLLAFK